MAVGKRLAALACVAGFIPALAHELTHYLAAKPFTSEAGFRVELTGTEAIAVWQPIDNRAVRAFAFTAPTVFGALLAGLWLVSDVALSGWQWPLAVGLALYTMPSPADIRGALGKQTGDSQ